MTQIIFDNVHVWKLIHVCQFLLFPRLSKELLQLQNLELDSLLPRFYISVETKKSMNRVYKSKTDCSFNWGIFQQVIYYGGKRTRTRICKKLWCGYIFKNNCFYLFLCVNGNELQIIFYDRLPKFHRQSFKQNIINLLDVAIVIHYKCAQARLFCNAT